MPVRLSRAAEDDLAGIFDYTLDRWGEAQAAQYVAGLHDQMADLEAGRALTQPVEKRKGLQRITYRSHFLFVAPASDGWLVLRLLHRRSDIFRHLP